jgi:hypothetical protein
MDSWPSSFRPAMRERDVGWTDHRNRHHLLEPVAAGPGVQGLADDRHLSVWQQNLCAAPGYLRVCRMHTPRPLLRAAWSSPRVRARSMIRAVLLLLEISRCRCAGRSTTCGLRWKTVARKCVMCLRRPSLFPAAVATIYWWRGTKSPPVSVITCRPAHCWASPFSAIRISLSRSKRSPLRHRVDESGSAWRRLLQAALAL